MPLHHSWEEVPLSKDEQEYPEGPTACPATAFPSNRKLNTQSQAWPGPPAGRILLLNLSPYCIGCVKDQSTADMQESIAYGPVHTSKRVPTLYSMRFESGMGRIGVDKVGVQRGIARTGSLLAHKSLAVNSAIAMVHAPALRGRVLLEGLRRHMVPDQPLVSIPGHKQGQP